MYDGLDLLTMYSEHKDLRIAFPLRVIRRKLNHLRIAMKLSFVFRCGGGFQSPEYNTRENLRFLGRYLAMTQAREEI